MKKTTSFRRGQTSIEFFIITSFILLVAGVLISNTDIHLSGTKTLNNAALSKSVIDTVSSNANFVILGGNGSVVTAAVFVPKEATCINWDSTKRMFFCAIPGAPNNVYGNPIYFSGAEVDSFGVEGPAGISCASNGWLNVVVNYSVYTESSPPFPLLKKVFVR